MSRFPSFFRYDYVSRDYHMLLRSSTLVDCVKNIFHYAYADMRCVSSGERG